MVHPRQRQILQALWRRRQLSQSDIYALLGIRKNTICEDVAELSERGLIRIAGTEHLRRGRPRTSLEIDPERRTVLGLSLHPDHVELAELNLLGAALGEPVQKPVGSAGALIEQATALLRSRISPRTLAIGLSAPGLIDPLEHRVLLSSLEAGVSLQPIHDVAGSLSLIVENDVHAMAAQWLQSRGPEEDETILLVFIEDGRLGAALLVDGHPPASAIIGANELGHTRLRVDTPLCYCGHRGCLERICSSAFLQSTRVENSGTPKRSLFEHVSHDDGSNPRLNELLDLLGLGLANALNLLRPHRLVLASSLLRHAPFADRLLQSTRGHALADVARRLRIDAWDQPSPHPGQTAAWLALASLYRTGWDTREPLKRPADAVATDVSSRT